MVLSEPRLSFICPGICTPGSICLPSNPVCWHKPLSEQLSTAGLHGISARKVYPNCRLPYSSVSSYLTFSPLSAGGGRLFSVALSVGAGAPPCLSQVRCSVLSGLSSHPTQQVSDSLFYSSTKLRQTAGINIESKFRWHRNRKGGGIGLQTTLRHYAGAGAGVFHHAVRPRLLHVLQLN